MSGDTMHLPYRVAAADSTEAVEEAKRVCRAEGWTIRTIAGVRPATSGGHWIVTIVVRTKVPA